MKILKWIVWVSIALAVILVLLAGICLVFNVSLFGIGHAVNFLHASNSLLLLAIALYMVTGGLKGCKGT